MKSKIFHILSVFLISFWVACQPAELDKPEIGAAPSESSLSFTISPGANDFEVVIENTSSVKGIVKWDLGNGSKASGDKITAKYQLEGTYTITMSIFTQGGSASIKKDHAQTKTDYSIFTDPIYINLSGGANATNGKTWVLDSLSQGHLGVGPAGSEGLAWWSAGPLAKKGADKGMYDDELNINLNGFVADYVNHGKSYVKDFRKDDAAYSNPVQADVDYAVVYAGTKGKWGVIKEGGKNYLQLTGSSPIFPNFDVGAKDGKYEILSLSENKLDMVAIGGDGNAWHYTLIPKGYAKPKVEYTLSVAATANTNEYTASLTNVVIPSGLSISKLEWNLGDGTTQTSTDHTQSVTHTYMRKGTYNVSVKVTYGTETSTSAYSLVVANNHPSYVEYLLDQMVMYSDFGETQLVTFGIDGPGGSLTTVNNPNTSMYPNRSAHCGLFVKDHQPWTNVEMRLPVGYRFDLRQQTTFKVLVYGKAGDKVLLKMENTDRGGNAWQTGTELTYTIKEDNKWETAEYNFAGIGAGWDWTGDIFTSDVTTDNRFSHDFYNVVRIMINAGDDKGVYSVYLDDLAGPHVEGLK